MVTHLRYGLRAQPFRLPSQPFADGYWSPAQAGSRFDPLLSMDPARDARIGRMAEAIDCELLVAELAFSVSLSPSRFAYLFRRDTGRYHGVSPTGLRRRSWAALDWSGQRNPPINTPNGS